MIKKFIILFLIVFLITLSLLLLKKDDKYKLPRQYKIEIQKVIEDEAPKTKKEIDEIVEEVKIDVEKYKNNPSSFTRDELIDLVSIPDDYIYSPLFYYYLRLVEITEKYTKKESDLATDFYIDLLEYVYPYLITNKIDLKKINEVDDYTEYQRKIIKNYLKNVKISDTEE